MTKHTTRGTSWKPRRLAGIAAAAAITAAGIGIGMGGASASTGWGSRTAPPTTVVKVADTGTVVKTPVGGVSSVMSTGWG